MVGNAKTLLGGRACYGLRPFCDASLEAVRSLVDGAWLEELSHLEHPTPPDRVYSV